MSARRAALGAAILLGVALAVVIALRTPWSLLPTPPGGPAPLDPTAGIPQPRLHLIEAFAAAIRPASLAGLLLGLAVAAVLGLTRLGSGLVSALGRLVGRRWPLEVLLGTVVLVLIGNLVVLPVSAYGEMVEHRYRLSTSTWWLWARDYGVSTAITAGVSAIVLLLVVWVARRAPRTWWAWVTLAAAVLVVVGSFLWPVLVEPAFNQFRPLPAGHLRTDLLDLARRNGTPVQDVLVSDASRRTTALNAYVSGFGSTRRIVIYDTVLEQLPDDEIESIVAHELGHVSADDVLTGTLIGALGAAAGVALLGWLLTSPPLLRWAGASGPGDPRVVALVLFLVTIGQILATPVQDVVSRQIEARADLHALNLARDPAAFIAMQRQLAAVDLTDPDPPPAWQIWFGTHPTAPQRIQMAENWTRLHSAGRLP